MNRFKGLDLVNGVPEDLWPEVCNNEQEAVNKTIPKEKKSNKAKWLFEEALQIAEERSEKQGRKGKVHRTKCRIPKNKVETSRPFSINSGNRGKQQKGKD